MVDGTIFKERSGRCAGMQILPPLIELHFCTREYIVRQPN